MVTKASGLDKIAASFNDKAVATEGKTHEGGLKRAAAAAKATRKTKPTKVDERDPAVVAAQETCGSCGAADHGFNDCPNTESLAAPTSRELSAPITNGKALAARVFFSEDGWLTLPKDLPFEGYKELVTRFGGLHKNMLWMAGDLQAQGEALYGQDYSQVVEMLAGHGYTESTLGIAKSLSEKFPPSDRNKDLSWNHHVIVMTLAKKERKHWLDRAAAENLSTRELKAAIAEGNGKPSGPAKPKQARTLTEATEVVQAAVEADEPDEEVGASVPAEREQPVVAHSGVSLEMLERADAADKNWYDALSQSIEDFKASGSFDYDTLRGPTRALAAELVDLIRALGDPRAK